MQKSSVFWCNDLMVTNRMLRKQNSPFCVLLNFSLKAIILPCFLILLTKIFFFSSEIQKKKSRDAARQRRGQQNDEFSELAGQLPIMPKATSSGFSPRLLAIILEFDTIEHIFRAHTFGSLVVPLVLRMSAVLSGSFSSLGLDRSDSLIVSSKLKSPQLPGCTFACIVLTFILAAAFWRLEVSTPSNDTTISGFLWTNKTRVSMMK